MRKVRRLVVLSNELCKELIMTENKNIERMHDIESILGGYHFSDPRFDSYLTDVLKRLPQDAFDFFSAKNLMFIQPPGNSFFEFDADLLEHTLLIFTSDLCDESQAVILYTIAHEFAHVYLGHKQLTDDPYVELEADKQVIAWGFENELRKSGSSYLYGSGKEHLKLLKNLKTLSLQENER